MTTYSLMASASWGGTISIVETKGTESTVVAAFSPERKDIAERIIRWLNNEEQLREFSIPDSLPESEK